MTNFLKAFADIKVNVKVKLKFVFGSIVNIVGKGENARLPGLLKVGMEW